MKGIDLVMGRLDNETSVLISDHLLKLYGDAHHIEEKQKYYVVKDSTVENVSSEISQSLAESGHKVNIGLYLVIVKKDNDVIVRF
jgi:3-dehydroquinate synthetase